MISKILNDPKKMLVIGVILIILILIIVHFRNQSNLAKVKGSPVKNPIFPLKLGSTGKEVGMLQTYLRSLDTTALPSKGIDNVFGDETQTWSDKLLGKKEIDEDYFNTVVKPGYSFVAGLVNQINFGLSSAGF